MEGLRDALINPITRDGINHKLIAQFIDNNIGRMEGPRAAPTHPAQPITIQEMDALFQEKILQKFLARVCA
jgi:hypothetical protein